MKYRTKNGEVLDHIVWRHYGVCSGAVEAVLATNPKLAEHGSILPSGLLITLPHDQPPQKNQRVALWD